MGKYSARKPAAVGSSRAKQVGMVVFVVVALVVAGVLLARRAMHEEKTVPDMMPVTCKTCQAKYEVPYEVFRQARDEKREMVAFCPQCKSEQPCYTGPDPDLLPGQIPPMKMPGDD